MNTKNTVKCIIVIAIFLAIIGYLVNGYFKKKARERAAEAETEKIEQSIRSTVAQMALRFNASSDWAEKLSNAVSN